MELYELIKKLRDFYEPLDEVESEQVAQYLELYKEANAIIQMSNAVLKDKREKIMVLERALELACCALDDAGVCNIDHDEEPERRCSDDPKVNCSDCAYEYFLKKARNE